MNILSADTSTAILSLALKTDTSYEERMVDGNFAPSENLMGEIKSMLERAHITLKDLNLLICTRGPGSFTGLRIAMSLMKGISYANDIPLVSVPTLSVIEESVRPLRDGYILSVIDAKKKRFYFRLSLDGETLIPDRDESPEIILQEVLDIDTDVLVTGPDALTFFNKAKEIKPENNLILDTLSPRNLSKALIKLGLEAYSRDGADDIGQGPVYIRRSDAEEMLLSKTLEEQNGR